MSRSIEADSPTLTLKIEVAPLDDIIMYPNMRAYTLTKFDCCAHYTTPSDLAKLMRQSSHMLTALPFDVLWNRLDVPEVRLELTFR